MPLSRSLLRLTELEFLDISLNQFSLDVAALFGFGRRIRQLSLAGNGLDFRFSANTNCSGIRADSMNSLDLSRNSISGDIADVIRCLGAAYPNVASLDLSRNLVSSISRTDNSLCPGTYPAMPRMLRLSLAHNAVSDIQNVIAQLQLSVKGMLTGDSCVHIPAVSLDTLDLSACPLDATPFYTESALPRPDSFVFDEASNLTCPAVQINLVASYVLVPPDFRNYSDCECPPATPQRSWYYNRQTRKCQVCPFGCQCSSLASDAIAERDHIIVEPGYWPLSANKTFSRIPDQWPPISVVYCYVPSLCNPPPVEYRFHCAPGHDEESLMCSRCLAGHFALDSTCATCSDFQRVLFAIAGACVFAFLAAYAWTYEYAPQASALLSSSFFWLQLTNGLQTLNIGSSSTSSDSALSAFKSVAIEKLVSVSPWYVFASEFAHASLCRGIECIWAEADFVNIAWLQFSIFFLLFLLAAAIGLLIRPQSLERSESVTDRTFSMNFSLQPPTVFQLLRKRGQFSCSCCSTWPTCPLLRAFCKCSNATAPRPTACCF